jgi:hypothetical protein
MEKKKFGGLIYFGMLLFLCTIMSCREGQKVR